MSDYNYIYGTSGNDILHGTTGNDVFTCYSGNDVVYGMGGQDIVYGGGSTGLTTVNYSWAPNGVKVDLSNEAFQNTGAGWNMLVHCRGLTGSNYDDYLVGPNADGVLDGGKGNDTLIGSIYVDKITGGAGNDVIDGGAGDDTLTGVDGNDTITGGYGADNIDGGTGNDVINAGPDDDVVTGNLGNDIINGGTGNDTLNGSDGDDVLDGGVGQDKLIGGSGYNTVSYADATSNVTVNLLDLTGHSNSGDAIGDTFSAIQRFDLGPYNDTFTDNVVTALTVDGEAGDDVLTGGGYNDTLIGDAGNDTLIGGGNADTLNGGDGNDILIGGAYADTLTGGAGNDIFRFTALTDSTPAHPDTVTDFSSGDQIDLSAIDANTKVAGNQAFVLVHAFSHMPGQAVLAYANGITSLSLDVDGNGVADFVLKINGHPDSYANWILL